MKEKQIIKCNKSITLNGIGYAFLEEKSINNAIKMIQKLETFNNMKKKHY
jgi:hypothetical protein